MKRGSMKYPFDRQFIFPKRSIIDRAKTLYDNARVSIRERRSKQNVELLPAKPIVPLNSIDVPLVFITHNDMALLPSFLKHYRKIGVTRFICVDDVSNDGTKEYLLEQPDIDVWTSNIRFEKARRGRRWREGLFGRYGYGRWYINVDSDEFLIYDQCPEETIPALIQVLEDNGIKRLPAPMLDIYPGVETDNAVDGDLPWFSVNRFDADGYEISYLKRGISVKGGPRKRLFNEENELIKYPLIYWDKHCYFGSSIHRPLPYNRNFAPIWGVLLHFKFFTNYREKIAEAVDGRQHYNGSQHYQTMKEELDQKGGIDFMAKNSARFTNPAQLVELGFMPSICYDLDDEPRAPYRVWK